MIQQMKERIGFVKHWLQHLNLTSPQPSGYPHSGFGAGVRPRKRSPNPRIALVGSIKVMSNCDMIEKAPLLMMSGITSWQGTSSFRPASTVMFGHKSDKVIFDWSGWGSLFIRLRALKKGFVLSIIYRWIDWLAARWLLLSFLFRDVLLDFLYSSSPGKTPSLFKAIAYVRASRLLTSLLRN